MKETYEILKEAIDHVGAKRVATRLGVSASLVYKWCQKPEAPESLELASGAANPLDRLRIIYEETKDQNLIRWFCELEDGFFVKNVQSGGKTDRRKIVENIQSFIKEFSETLHAISSSYEDDKRISLKEAQVIRKEWEELKGVGEAFVCACESGQYK